MQCPLKLLRPQRSKNTTTLSVIELSNLINLNEFCDAARE